jgi:hypothetical protein
MFIWFWLATMLNLIYSTPKVIDISHGLQLRLPTPHTNHILPRGRRGRRNVTKHSCLPDTGRETTLEKNYDLNFQYHLCKIGIKHHTYTITCGKDIPYSQPKDKSLLGNNIWKPDKLSPIHLHFPSS